MIELVETDCRTCKHYREQQWDDFCYYKGHKIVFLDRRNCEGWEPRHEAIAQERVRAEEEIRRVREYKDKKLPEKIRKCRNESNEDSDESKY